MDLSDILERYNVDVAGADHRHARPGWLQVDCPFCGEGSGKYHLGFNLAHAYANCWQCGSHPLLKTLAELTGERYDVLKGLTGKLDRFRLAEGDEAKPRGKLVLPERVGPMMRCHRDYLAGRGFDPDELERLWELQGIGIAERLQWRIFIPIRWRGKVVSWTTRAIGDRISLRYVAAAPDEESISAKTILYGADYVRHAVLVTEGPTGPWRFGPGTVATLGLGHTSMQANRIARWPFRFICFDNEPEAQKRARKLADDLSVMPGETHVVYLDSPDPGSATDKEVRQIRRTIFGE